MDEFDAIDPTVEAGTIDYWKHRARQWQARCQRAEREKTELLLEIEKLRLAALGAKSPREDRRRAIMTGESLGGMSGAPSARGWH